MDIAFKPVALEDKALIDPYYKRLNSRSCDDCFTTLYLWKYLEPMSWALIDSVLVLKSDKKDFAFRFPIGEREKLPSVLETMIRLADEKEVPFVIRLITREQFKVLDEICPGKFRFEEDRAVWDYLYETEALSQLPGRRYHGQKNHVNQFLRNYRNWALEPLDDHNVEEAFTMGLKWRQENEADCQFGKRVEMCVALNSLRLLKELNLTGAVLRVDGEVAAYTVGERLAEDTFVVHVEKALSEIEGAYPVINQQFVRSVMGDYAYVNREDDAGSEGLRKAKLSYHPAMMAEKGTVTLS